MRPFMSSIDQGLVLGRVPEPEACSILIWLAAVANGESCVLRWMTLDTVFNTRITVVQSQLRSDC